MKTWNLFIPLHVLSVLIAFQGGENKKDDKEKSRPAPTQKKTETQKGKQEQAKDDQEKALQPKAVQAKEGGSADERAIRHIVEQFEKAFNDHDAKAVGALFGKEAEMVNADGHQSRGRDDIEQSFSEFFEESPAAALKIEIDSIRALGSSLMIEEGTSSLAHEKDGPQEIVRYTVIYSKEGEEWIMNYARDTTADGANDEQIKDLAWMIGDWIDESTDAVVVTTYRWTDNQRALEGEFHLHAAGYPSLDGTHRVAWDPQAKQLRSWIFDSSGGFGSGLWSPTNHGWMIKMNGVLDDGRLTSATNTLTRKGEDHLVFQSVDRVFGGTVLPDGDEISIVRHAPAPDTVSVKE